MLMTEIEIKEIGFVLIKSYDHDRFNTSVFKKGIIEVDFTYDNKKLLDVNLSLDDVSCLTINNTELKHLDNILNK